MSDLDFIEALLELGCPNRRALSQRLHSNDGLGS